MAYDASKVAGGKGNFSLNQNFDVEGFDLTILLVDFNDDVAAEVGNLTTRTAIAGLKKNRHAFLGPGPKIYAEGPLVDAEYQKSTLLKKRKVKYFSSHITKEGRK